MNLLPEHRVGVLGPAGTFSEEALRTQQDIAQSRVTFLESFGEILVAVDEGELDFGFVALENAIEGTVNVTLDTLAFDVDLMIQREVVLPLTMNLLTLPGTSLGEITTVLSYPHAYSQCRSWLRRDLPHARVQPASSTADAARRVQQGGDRTVAAIGNVRAAEVYSLEIAAKQIEDHVENATRFALVGKDRIPAPTGHDKTSLVVFQRADAPGSLLSILHEFAARQINLTLLLSRPTRTTLGDYCFMVDLEGHIANEVVADCVAHLKAFQADVKFLGSYPAGGPQRAEAVKYASDAMRDASSWLDALRKQVD